MFKWLRKSKPPAQAVQLEVAVKLPVPVPVVQRSQGSALVRLSDPGVERKIRDRLELLSLPPSLTSDNLDRTLKNIMQWHDDISTDDHIPFAQLVIPALVHYFHYVYTLDALERRVDSKFLSKVAEQPSFHLIVAIIHCIPPANRSEYNNVRRGSHGWMVYHIRIIQTLRILLTVAPVLSLDSVVRDIIAIDLSDALVKSRMTSTELASLDFQTQDVIEIQLAQDTLVAHVGSLSDHARLRVSTNLAPLSVIPIASMWMRATSAS